MLATETAKVAQLERELAEERRRIVLWVDGNLALKTRADAAESALSEARARTIQELIEVAEISAKLLAEQEAEIARALPNADGFVAGGVAMATRLAEGFRKLLAGASGAAGNGVESSRQ